MPKSPPHKKYGVIVIAAGVAICVAFLLAANGSLQRRQHFNETLTSQKRVDYVICKRVNHIYLTIQEQVRKSETLTPKIAYYKKHPAELHRVMHSLDNEYKAFAPQHCPSKPKGG